MGLKNADETSNLNYEIERWNTNGVSIVWVQVPLLTSNASIWAYWGDPDLAAVPAACTTNGATWDSNFKAVWHLGETVTDEATGGANHFDSTTNGYTGIQYGNDDVEGKIGKAQEFDGDDYLVFPGLTWRPTCFGVSFWLKPDTTLNWNQEVGAVGNWGRFKFHTTSAGHLYVGITADDDTGRFGPADVPAGTMVTGVWQQFTFTFDNGAAAVYKNGTRLAAKNLAMPTAWANGFQLASTLDGMVDECRIDAVARSSNWVWACWLNQQSNLVFDNFGVAQDAESRNHPWIVTDAAATPATVTGTSATLAVLGGDEWGEDTLTYTWATNGAAPAPVTYTVNGDNAAKSTTATFQQAGSYAFKVMILNWDGMTTSSVVGVTVNETLSALRINPSSCAVSNIFSSQFSAFRTNQFGRSMTITPTWSVSGGGMIDTTGCFTAASTGGVYAVTAAYGGMCATATVTVVSDGPDADCDGLADNVETGTGIFVSPSDTGTNPNEWDTDHDGIGDGAEVKIWHTDPNNPDTSPPVVSILFPASGSWRVWKP